MENNKDGKELFIRIFGTEPVTKKARNEILGTLEQELPSLFNASLDYKMKGMEELVQMYVNQLSNWEDMVAYLEKLELKE